MADCCDNQACTLDALAQRQSATLKIVLGINALMFVVELAAGLLAGSAALLADALDNLGDALTYGLSLYAVGRGARAKAGVALCKGLLILAAALFVLAQVIHRSADPVAPTYQTMGLVSLLALLANASCLTLLWKHRAEDLNMASVWECSRNDMASNLSVFAAAGAVWATASAWPDILIGAALAMLFLKSALRVLSRAILALRQPDPAIAVEFTGRRKQP